MEENLSLYYTLPITGVIEIISPTTFASSFAYMSGKRLIVQGRSQELEMGGAQLLGEGSGGR